MDHETFSSEENISSTENQPDPVTNDEIKSSSKDDKGNSSVTKESTSSQSELDYYLSRLQFLIRLPLILALLEIFLFFVWGLVDSFAIGIFGFGGIGAWCIWMLIGIISSIILCFVLNAVISQKILEIYYLQKLAGEKKTILDD